MHFFNSENSYLPPIFLLHNCDFIKLFNVNVDARDLFGIDAMAEYMLAV